MPSLDDSYELIGRILAKLILGGLSKQDMRAADVLDKKVSFEDSGHFSDVVMWLLSEGLVTRRSAFMDGTFRGLQLTAKGIAAIEKGSFREAGGSVRDVVEAKGEGGLTQDTYGKIGSFVGGLLGSFVQSAQ